MNDWVEKWWGELDNCYNSVQNASTPSEQSRAELHRDFMFRQMTEILEDDEASLVVMKLEESYVRRDG